MDNLPIVWIVVAVILAGVEMLTGTFYLLVMAIASAAAALAAWLGAPLAVQVFLWIVVAIFGAFLVWHWHKKHGKGSRLKENNMEIGQVVVWEANKPDGSWQVRYRGAQWQARPLHASVNPKDALVIKEMQGNLLLLDNLTPRD